LRRNSRKDAVISVERIGELADLVAGSAGKDEVQVSFPDLFGGIRQPGDRPQDPFSREETGTPPR